MSKLMSLAIRLTRMLAEHDPAAAGGRGKRRQRGLGAHRHLTFAGSASELFDTVGVHGAACAPVTQIAATGAERMRSFDADIAGIKREGVATLHAVPLESLQVKLRHDRVAVIRVEDIDVLGAESCS